MVNNTRDLIDSILEKEYSPTETTLSTTTTREKDFLLGNEIEREKGFFKGESLSAGFKRVYGNEFDEIPLTIFEQVELDKYKDIFKLIEKQKVYHITGLAKQFEFATRYKVEIVQEILVRRRLLITIPVVGKADSTLGLILVCTSDCTQDDVDSYLISFKARDQLRYIKQRQRKNKKSPQEIVNHNEKVKELTNKLKEKQFEKEEDLCIHNANKRVCEELGPCKETGEE